MHTAATRELAVLTREAAATVRAMDARIRLRYQGDRQALEQWVSAWAVIGLPVERPKEAGTPSPGWDAGGGRRCEARSVIRGLDRPGWED